MTAQQKRGALLFFGKAGCVTCHAVAGQSNEMFSDFQNARHRRAADRARLRRRARATSSSTARTRRGLRPRAVHRQSGGPLQVPHGAAAKSRRRARLLPQRRLRQLEDAIRFHLNVFAGGAAQLRSGRAGVPDGSHVAPRAAGAEKLLDPLFCGLHPLTPRRINDLVSFVRDGLLDPRVNAATSASSCRRRPERQSRATVRSLSLR